MQLTDEQLVDALKENGRDDLARGLGREARGQGVKGERPSPGPTMPDLIRGKRPS